MVAIVFAAALALAGAQPAAAQGFGWHEAWDWLSSLWGGGVTLLPARAADGDCGLEIDPNGCPRPHSTGAGSGSPTTDGDCGPEIDPDGCPRPHSTGTGSGS
jgi:hypothetical protein